MSLELGQLLCAVALDSTVTTPIAIFARDVMNAKKPMQSIEETVALHDHELAQEENDIELQMGQCSIAKEKLVAELQRVEQQMKELEERRRNIEASRKFCSVARSVDFGSLSVPEPGHPMSRPSFSQSKPDSQPQKSAPQPLQQQNGQANNEQQQALPSNHNSSASGGLETEHLITLLRNPDVKEQTLMTALAKHENSMMSAIDTPLRSDEKHTGFQVATEIVSHLREARPPLQIVELRILVATLKRSNATSSAAGSELKHSLRNAGIFAQLTKLISSVNDDVKCDAFDCLALIMTDDDDTVPFVECGGIPPLINVVASSQSEAVLERSLVIMWTLASVDDSLRSLIRGEGGLRATLDLLFTDSMVILENITTAIGFLTREEATKDAIRDNRGLEKLVATLYHPSPIIQGKVCGSIWNCASNETNRKYLKQIGCIPALLELLGTSRNEIVLENAAGAIWNLASDADNKTQIADFGGIPILIAHMNSTSVGTLVSVVGTMWNLSSCVENRPTIRKAGGIPVIINLLDHADSHVQENVAGLLRNLSINDQNKTAVREHGGIEKLLSLIPKVSSSSHLEKLISTMWILSIATENKHQLRNAGGIPLLVNLLGTTTVDGIREKVLGILRHTAALPENRVPMLEAGVISTLASYVLKPEFLRSPTSTKEAFAALVWNLSREDKECAARAGLVRPISSLLSDRELGVVEQAAGALASITVTNTDNRVVVREVGALETAMRLIGALAGGQDHPATLLNLVLVVRNCTSANVTNQQLMVQLKVIEPLLQIMRGRKDDLCREAALCLKNAACLPLGASEIAKQGGRELIAETADRSTNENLRKAAASVLQTMNKTLATGQAPLPGRY